MNINMLLSQKAHPLPVARQEPPPQATAASLIDRSLGFVRRQYRIILFCLLLASAVGGFYLFTTPPSYTASATMIMDPRKGQFFQQQSVLGDTPVDSAWIDSQIGKLSLERDQVALTVAKSLHLGSDPELAGTDSGLLGALGAFVSNLFQGRNDPESEKPKPEAELLQLAAGAVAGRIEVRRVGFTYLITINFSSRNPEHAVKIANAVADAYIVVEEGAKSQAIGRASEWLQERYQTLREQASAAERAVVEFKSQHNIVTTGGKLINEQEVSELNTRLVAARARTDETQARLSRIDAIIRADRPDAAVDATVSDTLNNPIINKLRSQYLDISGREADWSVRYGPDHLVVVNLRNQKREIRKSILDELRRIAETYRSDFEIAKKNQSELEKRMAEVVSQIPNEAQITLRGLESSAQSYRTFYDNFLLHYTESVQQQTSPISETAVVASASGAYKSSPQTSRVAAMTVLGGILLGLGLGMLRETMDRVFRTTSQVRSVLGAECLALVPVVKNGKAAISPAEPVGDARRQRIVHLDSGASRTVIDAPFSRFAESIRAIKLAIDLSGASKSVKVVGLTSSVPREGKSTVAAALGELIAQVGARVILVDCDLRNPSLSRALAPNAVCGILDVISGNRSLQETIWKDPLTNMAFLPAVTHSRLANTSQILASDETGRLFDVLRANYDYIIVDLSPIAPVVDVRATTHLVDSYVLLVEWGQTKIDVVQHALRDAPEISGSVLGVVLNKVDMNNIGRYEVYRAKYYRNKYFARYGYED